MYWYDYYGKRFAPEHERNKIMELQQLSRIPFELGNSVHITIAEILKDLRINGKVISLEEARKTAVDKFDILVQNKPLVEKRLGYELTTEERDKIHSQIRTSMTTFYGSKWLTMMQDMPRHMWDGWHIDPDGYGEFRIDGKKAYAKPDLLFEYKDGRHYLVEWKTGKPHREQNMFQVQVYLFYAKDILGLDLENTVAVVQYLTYPSEKPIEVEGRLINPMEMKNRVMDELKLIESLCEDVTKNIPKPLGHFPRTETLGYCKMCKYREICRPDM